MRITEDLKSKILELRKEGLTYEQISVKLNIKLNQVVYWIKDKYRERVKELNKPKNKIYYYKNKEKINLKRREYNKIYYKNKYKTDEVFREKQKQRSREYKKMSIKTTMVRQINELKKDLQDLQGAYDLAMKENNRLRAKRKYWEECFKKLEAKFSNKIPEPCKICKGCIRGSGCLMQLAWMKTKEKK